MIVLCKFVLTLILKILMLLLLYLYLCSNFYPDLLKLILCAFFWTDSQLCEHLNPVLKFSVPSTANIEAGFINHESNGCPAYSYLEAVLDRTLVAPVLGIRRLEHILDTRQQNLPGVFHPCPAFFKPVHLLFEAVLLLDDFPRSTSRGRLSKNRSPNRLRQSEVRSRAAGSHKASYPKFSQLRTWLN